MRRLASVLACRNQGSRLYGKPLQNLDVSSRVTVLHHIVQCIQSIPIVDRLALGISEGSPNLCFVEIAKDLGLPYIVGDEHDVLSRLISAAEHVGATDVLRTTSESPFLLFEAVETAWSKHKEGHYDFSCLDHVPDGTGFEIITLEALKKSHREGAKKHRSELCTLFIREHKDQFKIQQIEVDKELQRFDLRLTIDNPEDLVLCRSVYREFQKLAPRIPVREIIKYLDENKRLRELVSPYVEVGLQTMYL